MGESARSRSLLRVGPSTVWLAAALFFSALLVTGLAIYRDYGVSWDETTQQQLGILNYRYLTRQDPALLSFRDRYYGPLFELTLIVLQTDSPPNEVYYSRHLITFLAFFAGVVGFFGLTWYLFKRPWLALFGCLMLVLSPRIFADAFYNSKDIPFLVFYLFSIFSLVLFTDRPSLKTAALHAFVTAAMLAVRLPGLVIPALTIGILGIKAVNRQIGWKRFGLLAFVYLAASGILLVVFWPALWHNPPGELLEAFRMMKSFPHQAGMLFFGRQITSDALPWYYVPAWIAITTPPMYVGLFLFGLACMLARLVRHPVLLLEQEGQRGLILLGAAVLPLLAVITLRSTLYDGWRQMYFVYPPLLLIGLWGLDWLIQWSRWKRWQMLALILVMLVGGLTPVTAWMVRAHPYQHIYFNRLAGPDLGAVKSRFPVDYWGLSYREGLEYVLDHAAPGPVPVYVESEAGVRSAVIFPAEAQQRLVFVKNLQDAEYYLGNFYTERSYPFNDLVFTVTVDGSPILVVYHLSLEERE